MKPVWIGASAATESYLDADRIIAAAKEAGAEAIHPGYGFLSENASFARAVEKAGLIWVGPKADTIEAMGLKDRAKAIAEEAGVPVLPGYRGEAQDAKSLTKEATRIGYPLLIKAVAGGGGRGIRLVAKAKDLASRARKRGARSRSRLWRWPRHAGKTGRTAAPYRGAGVWRQPWQCRPPVRAGLFPAAPPPESHRGSPGPRHAGKRPQGDVRRGGQARQIGRL